MEGGKRKVVKMGIMVRDGEGDATGGMVQFLSVRAWRMLQNRLKTVAATS